MFVPFLYKGQHKNNANIVYIIVNKLFNFIGLSLAFLKSKTGNNPMDGSQMNQWKIIFELVIR
jgi:hypothetical protein